MGHEHETDYKGLYDARPSPEKAGTRHVRKDPGIHHAAKRAPASMSPPALPPAQDLDEEQVLVARLLHHLRSDDPDTHFAILGAVRQQLLEGGPLRMRTTLPALVFCGLALHRRIAERAGGGGSSSSGDSKGPVDGGKQEEEGEKEEEEEKEEGEGEGQEAEGKEGSGKAAAKEAAAPPKVRYEAGALARGGGLLGPGAGIEWKGAWAGSRWVAWVCTLQAACGIVGRMVLQVVVGKWRNADRLRLLTIAVPVQCDRLWAQHCEMGNQLLARNDLRMGTLADHAPHQTPPHLACAIPPLARTEPRTCGAVRRFNMPYTFPRTQVTCEALLQFLLAAIDPLTGGPAAQPLTALRLLLACAHAASEEAGLEVLGSTLLEEVRRVGHTLGEGQR